MSSVPPPVRSVAVIINRMGRIRRALRDFLRELPIPLRHAAIGVVGLGVPAGIVGLVIGLLTYVPTAWAATFELATPGALVGFMLGLVSGSLVYVHRRVHHG